MFATTWWRASIPTSSVSDISRVFQLSGYSLPSDEFFWATFSAPQVLYTLSVVCMYSLSVDHLNHSAPRALELFAEQLLQKAGEVTLSRGSRTLSPAHL